MPQRAPHPCPAPGCSALVRHGRCDQHAAAAAAPRDRAPHRLYKTARWLKLRKAQLARSPWCEACQMQGVFTPATDVHHVERHGGDASKFFKGPFECLCHACHSRVTIAEVRHG